MNKQLKNKWDILITILFLVGTLKWANLLRKRIVKKYLDILKLNKIVSGSLIFNLQQFNDLYTAANKNFPKRMIAAC